MATLTKHYILRYESYFFIFRAFALFQKNIEKLSPKFKPRCYHQKPPKMVPGDPFWIPKWSQINVGESKNTKNAAKRLFFDLAVFWINFETRKTWISAILGLKMGGWAVWAGTHGREPEGGFHPPWRVLTTSRSGTEWNVATCDQNTRLHRG